VNVRARGRNLDAQAVGGGLQAFSVEHLVHQRRRGRRQLKLLVEMLTRCPCGTVPDIAGAIRSPRRRG
jgi:hypothetical protein